MTRMLKVFRKWLPLAVTVTALCGLVYLTAQHSLRQGANDPQIQLAEDAAAALNGGKSLERVVPTAIVEFSNSLAPFVVVYDGKGNPIASSGLLHGKMPDYPAGALEAARQSGENRVTWQPEPTVRVASVAVPYKEGTVVAGRSLREVEQRDQQLQAIAAAAWAAALGALLLVVAVDEYVLGSWQRGRDGKASRNDG